MKYKVGDKVRIKSLDWYNKNKDEYGNIDVSHDFTFYADRSKYCGKVFTIDEVFDNWYTVKEDNHEYYWADEMIEGLVEDIITTNEQLFEPSNISLEKEMEWNLPEGYQFVDENGNIINATKIVLEKKKKEYPKTYEECCKVLSLSEDGRLYTKGYKASLIQNFQKLYICRDAYWKIAGEKMGLGKPWEPDWEDENQEKYIIGSWLGTIQGLEENFVSHPFSFPTAEMRDAFKENFDPDIEICKELL